MLGRAIPGHKKGPQFRDFLPEAQMITETRHSPMATLLMIVICVFFGAMLLWAGLATVDQSVIASGSVRPGGKVKTINHTEGGRVADILVRDGDRVEQGQPLLTLDQTLIQAEVDRVTGELQAAEAALARLTAETTGSGVISFPQDVTANRPDLVATHTRLFRARQEVLQARQSSADRDVEQRASEIASLKVRQRTQLNGERILQQQVKSLGELAGKGFFPWLRFQSIERQLSDLQGQISETREAIRSANAALSAAQTRRKEVDDEARSVSLAELAEASSQRDQLAASFAQQTNRLNNIVVRSPVTGYIQNLAVHTVGQSIRASEEIMAVVPETDNLVIQVKVQDKDIGFVELGQEARVKLTAFDFVKYGSLDGKVEKISSDSNRDERTQEVFYVVDIRTDRNYLGDNPGDKQAKPGMRAEVEMTTGSRSVLSYLTDRVTGTADSAFRER